jgi:hypothetical protein
MARDSIRMSSNPDPSDVGAGGASAIRAWLRAASENRTLCSLRSPGRGAGAGAGSNGTDSGAHTWPPSGVAGTWSPLATTIAAHFLQRIFTILPRTLSSAIEYLAPHVWHDSFMAIRRPATAIGLHEDFSNQSALADV